MSAVPKAVLTVCSDGLSHAFAMLDDGQQTIPFCGANIATSRGGPDSSMVCAPCLKGLGKALGMKDGWENLLLIGRP